MRGIPPQTGVLLRFGASAHYLFTLIELLIVIAIIAIRNDVQDREDGRT